MNRLIKAMLLVFCIVSVVIVFSTSVNAESTLTVDQSGPGNYTTIQDAINAANAGDTVFVHSGTYFENVVVNKTIELMGVDTGSGLPVVNGTTGNAISITADGVMLTGFTVTSAGTGIYVTSGNNTIVYNIAQNNGYGIKLQGSCNNNLTGNVASNADSSMSYAGIYLLYSSNNNSVIGNTVSSSTMGITLEASSVNNNVSSNMAYYCTIGIGLDNSNNNIVAWNIAYGNTVYGINVESSSNNNVTNNNVYGNDCGLGLRTSSNNKMAGNMADENNIGIYIYASGHNNVTDNMASYNADQGIRFYSGSSNNYLSGNIVNGNLNDGIRLMDTSNNNTIKGNTVNNNGVGINVWDSSDNAIWLNEVLGNKASTSIYGNGANFWNSAAPSQYTYKDTIYTNYTGNYWSDYMGSDSDGNGIGDTPYVIDANNVDSYPMMTGHVNPIIVDQNGNGTFMNITAAIAYAWPGDTIIVNSGTYSEGPVIETPRLHLIGNGAPVISGYDVQVLADDSSVQGFIIDGAGGTGVYVTAKNVIIKDNIIENAYYGVFLYSSSDNATVSGNTISYSSRIGVYIQGSNEAVTNNNINNGTNSAGIDLRDCINAVITNNSIDNNYRGIYIENDVSSCTITGNNISNNRYGIFSSSGAYASEGEGGSTENVVYLNYLIDNMYNAAYSSNTVWNSPTIQTYQYNGVTHTNYTGNYWSDYEGSDLNNDGIGDFPLTINGTELVRDNYPMILDLPRPPVADFIANKTIDYMPMAVQFTDISMRSPDTWYWEFGDGGWSNEKDPVHTYTMPGYYTVNLTVSNTYGECNVTKTDYILVLPPLPPGVEPGLQMTYPSNGASTYSVMQASDGGYVVTGGNYSSAFMMKTDGDGDPVWNLPYNNLGAGYGYKALQTDDGGYIFVGDAYYNGNYRLYVARTSSNGSLLWSNLYGSGGTDYADIIRVDGGYVITSSIDNASASNCNLYLLKISDDGSMIWDSKLGVGYIDLGWSWYWYSERGYDVKQTSDGGYIITGFINPKGMGSDLYLVKTNANGAQEWSKVYGIDGYGEYGYSVLQTSDGGYAVAGYKQRNSATDYGTDFWLLKVNDTGVEQWNQTYGGEYGGSMAYSLLPTSDDGFILGGYAKTSDGNQHPYIVETDANGTMVWSTILPVNIYDRVSLAPTTTGYVIAATALDASNNYYTYLATLSVQSIASDVTPPVTSCVLTGVEGINGEFYSNVTADLSATDIGIGVASVSYQLDGGALVTMPGSHARVTIVGNGLHTLNYSSIDRVGNQEPVKTRDIVINISTPAASFTENSTGGMAPLTVHFTDTSANYPTAWEWNFGDGTQNVTTQNATHTYAREGSYTVTLTVSNAVGSDTVRKADAIAVTPLIAPNLYLYMYAPYSMYQGESMQYTLNYGNYGTGAAEQVVLFDTLPAGVDFVSATGGGVYYAANNTVVWDIGTLSAYSNGNWYGNVKVMVNVRDSVPENTNIRNTASLTAAGGYSADSLIATYVMSNPLPPSVNLGPINGAYTGTPTVYYYDTVTFTYVGVAEVTGVDITIHPVDGSWQDVTAPMTADGSDWTYSIQFYPRHGSTTVTYIVHYADASEVSVDFNIYIDPAGYIYDNLTGDRIEGAQVWLQWANNSTGEWESVPVGMDPAVMQPDVNPLITDANGQYQWDTLAGSYRVHVEAPGYEPADSRVVTVPPPVFDLNVGLTPIPNSFTLSLKQGWNLVSSPLVISPSMNVSAFKGTGVTMVARYNQTTGGFDIYRVGKTPTAFSFAEGLGYFLYSSNDTTFTVNGYSRRNQSTTISHGWNLIGWTNLTASNSKTLAEGLLNVTMLAKYNTATGSYDIYRVGKTPTPFEIKAGEGYFMYTTYTELQTLAMV